MFGPVATCYLHNSVNIVYHFIRYTFDIFLCNSLYAVFQPKEKQTELKKHIQQRKRKSLSDLFKILALLGMMQIVL